MNSAEIAAKCVEISKCLINKESGFHDVDLKVSKTVGNAARLAANLGKRGIISYEELGGISQIIKQDFSLTESVSLPILEELEWVKINRDNKKAYVEEYIPPVSDVLGTLGNEIWESNEPSEVDRATTESLSILKNRPISIEGLKSELSVSEDSISKTLNYGDQMNYFGTFNSTNGEEIVWTPFYWPDNIDNVLKFLKRQHYDEFEEIESISNRLSKYQGIPLDRLDVSDILMGGIESGFFPSAGVISNRINYEYIFKATPNFGIDPKNDIFEKARQIVASVRHGQYHAKYSRIMYPLYLLRSLRESRMKPHSYAKIQYAQLLISGVCKYKEIDVGHTKKYKIEFVDSPENNIAMDIAEQMLSGDDPSTASMKEPKIDRQIFNGVYNYSSELRQIKNRSQVSAIDHFERLIEVTSGQSF
jgi:hypothetical protein